MGIRVGREVGSINNLHQFIYIHTINLRTFIAPNIILVVFKDLLYVNVPGLPCCDWCDCYEMTHTILVKMVN